MQYQVLPYINPELVFALVANTTGAIYLDSSMSHEHYGRYSFIVLRPLTVFNAKDASFSQDILHWQQLFTANQTKVNSDLPPFSAGLVGYLSYDLGKQLEYIPSQSQNIVPDYYLGLYNQVIAFDHILHQCYIMVTPIVGYELDYAAQFRSLLALYNEACTNNNQVFSAKLPPLILKSNFTEAQYINAVEQAREYILAGDIFEVNLSQQFSTLIEENYPFALLYHKLRQVNPAPFAAYLNLGQLKILSASPERFLSIRNRHIETRPIKGTSKRSLNPSDDYQLAQNLKNSSKDRAENIMIVDLMRNDLAKICIPSSIHVSQLCGVESFTNLHHLVSVIEGQLSDAHSIFDIIGACFPGGSITGAPKIRAMQIIEELEGIRRGVYCGSIGYFSFNGNVDLSIAIRTLLKNNDELYYNVGGAITLDSDPLSEYYETLIKGQKLAEAINAV